MAEESYPEFKIGGGEKKEKEKVPVKQLLVEVEHLLKEGAELLSKEDRENAYGCFVRAQEKLANIPTSHKKYKKLKSELKDQFEFVEHLIQKEELEENSMENSSAKNSEDTNEELEAAKEYDRKRKEEDEQELTKNPEKITKKGARSLPGPNEVRSWIQTYRTLRDELKKEEKNSESWKHTRNELNRLRRKLNNLPDNLLDEQELELNKNENAIKYGMIDNTSYISDAEKIVDELGFYEKDGEKTEEGLQRLVSTASQYYRAASEASKSGDTESHKKFIKKAKEIEADIQSYPEELLGKMEQKILNGMRKNAAGTSRSKPHATKESTEKSIERTEPLKAAEIPGTMPDPLQPVQTEKHPSEPEHQAEDRKKNPPQESSAPHDQKTQHSININEDDLGKLDNENITVETTIPETVDYIGTLQNEIWQDEQKHREAIQTPVEPQKREERLKAVRDELNSSSAPEPTEYEHQVYSEIERLHQQLAQNGEKSSKAIRSEIHELEQEIDNGELGTFDQPTVSRRTRVKEKIEELKEKAAEAKYSQSPEEQERKEVERKKDILKPIPGSTFDSGPDVLAKWEREKETSLQRKAEMRNAFMHGAKAGLKAAWWPYKKIAHAIAYPFRIFTRKNISETAPLEDISASVPSQHNLPHSDTTPETPAVPSEQDPNTIPPAHQPRKPRNPNIQSERAALTRQIMKGLEKRKTDLTPQEPRSQTEREHVPEETETPRAINLSEMLDDRFSTFLATFNDAENLIAQENDPAAQLRLKEIYEAFEAKNEVEEMMDKLYKKGGALEGQIVTLQHEEIVQEFARALDETAHTDPARLIEMAKSIRSYNQLSHELTALETKTKTLLEPHKKSLNEMQEIIKKAREEGQQYQLALEAQKKLLPVFSKKKLETLTKVKKEIGSLKVPAIEEKLKKIQDQIKSLESATRSSEELEALKTTKDRMFEEARAILEGMAETKQRIQQLTEQKLQKKFKILTESDASLDALEEADKLLNAALQQNQERALGNTEELQNQLDARIEQIYKQEMTQALRTVISKKGPYADVETAVIAPYIGKEKMGGKKNKEKYLFIKEIVDEVKNSIPAKERGARYLHLVHLSNILST